VPIDGTDSGENPDVPRPPNVARRTDSSQSTASGRLGSDERVAAHRAYRAVVDGTCVASTDNAGGGPADRDSGVWAQALPRLQAAWEQHEAQYPEGRRARPRTDPDNSWSSGDARKLSPDQNSTVDRGYSRIREIADRDVIPKVLAVQAENPSRHLAGFDRRIKGADRLKEKVADRVRTKGQAPDQALAEIPDVVRFTFQYSESTYAAGLRDDVKRLEGRGFIQVERRNSWQDDQYKGINSRWKEPKSGVLFEVQFHTQASLEAKELTHKAYERIRGTVHDDERAELKRFQRLVNSMVPRPPGAVEIEDYRLGGKS
jgi:hypothetical protein